MFIYVGWMVVEGREVIRDKQMFSVYYSKYNNKSNNWALKAQIKSTSPRFGRV